MELPLIRRPDLSQAAPPRKLRCWLGLACLILVGSSVCAAQQPDQQPTASPQPTRPQQQPPAPAQQQAQGRQPAAQPAPQQNIRYWNTSWSFDSIDAKKLNQRLRAIGIDSGLQLEGNVTVRFQVGIPLNALRDGRAYKFQGRITSDRFRVDGVELLEFASSVNYENGLLTLQNLETRSGQGGSLAGRATLQLIPRGQLSANLNVDSLRLAPIVALVEGYSAPGQSQRPSSPLPLRGGEITGEVDFQAPIDTLQDPASWDLRSEFQASELTVRGLPPLNVQADQLTIKDNLLNLRDLQASSPTDEELSLAGSVQVELRDTQRFAFDITGNDLPLGRLMELAQADAEPADGDAIPSFTEPTVAGKVDLKAAGDGNLAEGDWQVEGSIASPSLVLLGLDMGLIQHNFRADQQRLVLEPRPELEQADETAANGAQLGRVELEYEQAGEALSLDIIQGEIFGGSISGSARVAQGSEGSHRFDLELDSLRPQIVRTEDHGSIAATLSGSVDWQVPADQVDRPAAHSGSANLQLRDLSLAGEVVGDLNVTASAEAGQLDLAAQGQMFGGTVDIETISNFEPEDEWSAWLQRIRATRFQLSGMRLETFLPIAFDDAPAVSGLVFADITLRQPPTAPTTAGGLLTSWRGQGTVELRQVRAGGEMISRQLTGRISLQDNAVIVERLSGYYAGGSIYVAGRIPIEPLSPRNRLPYANLHISLQRAELSDGLRLLGDAVADNFGGPVSGQLTLRGGDRWRLQGRVQSESLEVTAITFGRAHSSVEAGFDLDTSNWFVNFPDVSARIGRGRFLGEASLRSPPGRSVGFDLNSEWRADRVDFVRFLDELGTESSIAKGQMTGRLVLDGRAIRSTNDLNGRFGMRLGQTRGAALPGVSLAQQFLGPFSLVNTQFDNGEASGIIGRGAVTLQEFWLRGDRARVHATGKIWLANGRLDLEALIATGDFRSASENVVSLAQQYALQSLIPFSVFRELARLATDRTIVVGVRGTIDDPRVRLLPLETIREEAVRFLITEVCRLGIASAVGSSIYNFD